MSKIIIMLGLPASGKSTKAEELIRSHGNAVRLNKDLLRTMLHFDKFTGNNEALTRDAARTLAMNFLGDGINVIIDDTNMNPGTMQGWKDLAKELDAKVEVVDMTDVPFETCVERDAERGKRGGKSVGAGVIKNMALRYGLVPKPEKGYVLCDIDGTIANIDHRLHFVKETPKDWKGFFGGIEQDEIRREVQLELIRLHNEGYVIIFMSARPDTYREVTQKWLDTNGLSFAFTLIMRPGNDKRPDTEVKKGMLDMYFPDRGGIHMIFDDRPSIIRMWRELGLPVTDVGKGIEF